MQIISRYAPCMRRRSERCAPAADAEQRPPTERSSDLEAQGRRDSRRSISPPTSRRCPTNERQALAKLVEAAKVIDALFLRQVWAGNETMLLDLAARNVAARPRAAALLPDQQGPVVAARSQPAVRPRRARRSPTQANFYPADATQGGGRGWIQSLPRPTADARDRVLHDDPPRRRTASSSPCPTASNTRASSPTRRALLREAAALTTAADAQGVPREARRRRSSRNDYYDSDVAWMELDAHASSRPSVPTRCTRTSGSTTRRRSSRSSRSRRRGDGEAGAVRRASCRRSRTTCRSIRSIATRSSARLAPIRVVNVVFSAGDANRGVQTAAFNLPNDERVIRGEGRQARHAEEHAGREVREGAACRSRRSRWRRRTRRTSPSTRSSRTS